RMYGNFAFIPDDNLNSQLRNRQLLDNFFDGCGVLDAGEFGVEAALIEQLLVRAALDDFAVAQDEDLVCLTDCAQTMGDNKTGAASHEPLQRLLNQPFSHSVNASG